VTDTTSASADDGLDRFHDRRLRTTKLPKREPCFDERCARGPPSAGCQLDSHEEPGDRLGREGDVVIVGDGLVEPSRLRSAEIRTVASRISLPGGAEGGGGLGMPLPWAFDRVGVTEPRRVDGTCDG
jgi:hypothetical protein